MQEVFYKSGYKSHYKAQELLTHGTYEMKNGNQQCSFPKKLRPPHIPSLVRRGYGGGEKLGFLRNIN
jgi:hypothetical protein